MSAYNFQKYVDQIGSIMYISCMNLNVLLYGQNPKDLMWSAYLAGYLRLRSTRRWIQFHHYSNFQEQTSNSFSDVKSGPTLFYPCELSLNEFINSVSLTSALKSLSDSAPIIVVVSEPLKDSDSARWLESPLISAIAPVSGMKIISNALSKVSRKENFELEGLITRTNVKIPDCSLKYSEPSTVFPRPAWDLILPHFKVLKSLKIIGSYRKFDFSVDETDHFISRSIEEIASEADFIGRCFKNYHIEIIDPLSEINDKRRREISNSIESAGMNDNISIIFG